MSENTIKRPQDLLHLISFNFSLIPSVLHGLIGGVQVSFEKELRVDIHIPGQRNMSFIYRENWTKRDKDV